MSKDKRQFGFFKTAVIGALLVVVPVGIIGFALWQVVSVTKDMILPLIDSLPFDSRLTRILLIVSALLLVLLLCYFTGLAVRTRWGRRLRAWVERRILDKIPGYSVIRSLAHQYLGQEGEQRFRPVLVDLYDSGTRQVGFEMEETGNGMTSVFLPSAPAVTIGQVILVPQDRIYPIDATMHDAVEAVTMFGVGAGKLVGGETKEAQPERGD